MTGDLTKEVKIRIRGLQMQNNEDQVEVVAVGKMYEDEESGFVSLFYDEVVKEEENGVVQVAKNLLKLRKDQAEIIKRGPTKTHMVFVPNETTYTYYSTPAGELEVSIFTRSMERIKMPYGFHFRLQYDLELNQTFISQCNIDILVEG